MEAAYKENIGHIIKTLSNEVCRCIISRLSESGITHMQGLIIGYIYRHGEESDVFQKNIEAVFNIRRSTATEILKTMEKNGLLTKTAVPGDARLKKLCLTPKACEIHKGVDELIREVEKRMIDGISREELLCFYKTTKQIHENLIAFNNCFEEGEVKNA